jgi:hypothetical protein
VLRKLLASELHVELRAADVVAGIGVARFGQRGHGKDGDVLDRRHLARALSTSRLQELVLVAQEIGARLERSWFFMRASTMGGLIGLVM